MRVCDVLACEDFPCQDINCACYLIPNIELRPEKIFALLISEAAPRDPADHYYAGGLPQYAQTTLLAFQDAGAKVTSIQDIIDLGVYLTTAVKCAKTGYGITTDTINTCSHLLEREIALFPNIKVFLLMGDVAIKALNAVARRNHEPRVIPAGSTYKIRTAEYFYRGARALPSYLQAGPSFNIEKSKRRMIAEDITTALSLII